jgi:hypothetical protein
MRHRRYSRKERIRNYASSLVVLELEVNRLGLPYLLSPRILVNLPRWPGCEAARLRVERGHNALQSSSMFAIECHKESISTVCYLMSVTMGKISAAARAFFLVWNSSRIRSLSTANQLQ